MKKTKKTKLSGPDFVSANFFKHFWEKSWIYIRTMVDVVSEPILILDKELKIVAANEAFYDTFAVSKKNTEGKRVYDLGNGQWNIPQLKTLLESILPKKTFFKGFQVAHEFPKIGRRVIILNGRQIHVEGDNAFPSLIVLAMEDVTDIMVIAESLTSHAKQIETKLTLRTQRMEMHIAGLEKEMKKIKKDKKD